jgi:hypothetical protein
MKMRGPFTPAMAAVCAVALAIMAGSVAQAQYAQRAQQARQAAAKTHISNSRGVAATEAAATGGAMQNMSGGVTYPARNASDSARGVAQSASSSGLGGALTAYYLHTGRYPTTAEGLNALVTAPPGVKNWKGPYVAIVRRPGSVPFSDPWGNQYKYTSLTTTGTATVKYPSFEIRSLGPDGVANTADDLVING